MTTSGRNYVTFMVICVLVACIPSQGCPQQMTFGQSYLNQTLNGEKLPNILATDFTFQLDAPDAAGMYRARLHEDALIWQRLEVGPRFKSVSLFYSLDIVPSVNSNLSGGGLRFETTPETGRSISILGGVYDRGYCAEATCSVERNGFTGRIGYEYRKIQDLRWWGPSVSVGWRW